mmetsp:Transcript_41019/g.95821  ORF Transcript_41019/g.95821 Transcript_41019/m.95821 type:complete len:103 (-) Transcript_41019:742-1050(-)
MGDIFVSCMGGRCYQCGVEFARSKTRPFNDIEREVNGERLHITAFLDQLIPIVQAKGLVETMPTLFNLHRTLSLSAPVEHFLREQRAELTPAPTPQPTPPQP